MKPRESRTSQNTLSTTYTGHGCFVAIIWLIAVPMLVGPMWFAFFSHSADTGDRIGGAVTLGVVGLFTLLIGLAMATDRVELENGVLTQKCLLLPPKRIWLDQAREVVLRNIAGKTGRLEQTLVYGEGRTPITMLSSFRDYEQVRDAIVGASPRSAFNDRRVDKS